MDSPFNSQLDLLHERTLSTYQLRIKRTLTAMEGASPEDLVDELARLMDLTASERVLDEADYNALPGFDHPAARAVSERAAHLEEALAQTAGLPQHVYDQLEPMAKSEAERHILGVFKERLEQVVLSPTRTGMSQAATVIARSVLDSLTKALSEQLIEASRAREHGALAHLTELMDHVALMRGSLQRHPARRE